MFRLKERWVYQCYLVVILNQRAKADLKGLAGLDPEDSDQVVSEIEGKVERDDLMVKEQGLVIGMVDQEVVFRPKDDQSLAGVVEKEEDSVDHLEEDQVGLVVDMVEETEVIGEAAVVLEDSLKL